MNKIEKFWCEQDRMVQNRSKYLRWIDTGFREVSEYARSYGHEVAVILGTGPSLMEVKDHEWAALTRCFTVGINRVAARIQEALGRYDLPALNMIQDEWLKEDDVAFRCMNESFQKSEKKTLASFGAWAFYHDWAYPSYAGDPSWDYRMGLCLTPSRSILFNRTTVGAIHLCSLMGFRNIALIGVDHGDAYIEGERELAERGFRVIIKRLYDEGIHLYQCGRKACMNSVKKASLDKVLRYAGKNIQAIAG